MDQSLKRTEPTWFLKMLIALTHYYFTVLFGWAALFLIFGDRWWWLFLLSSFSEYLFLLLPVAFILALITRRRDLIIGFVVSLVLAGFLFGHLLMPPISSKHSSESQMTVMTSNVLGYNMNTEGIVKAIRESKADVVAIQELNPQTALAIQRDLGQIYPYQELLPQSGVSGMGVISRFPMQAIEIEINGDWVGDPQVVEVEWEGAKIVLVNYHAIPPYSLIPSKLGYTIAERERQLGVLIEFVKSLEEPLIALGDLNVTEQSTAHEIMESDLQDAWVKGGWGLGHTFPGAASAGSSRPSFGRFLSPKWLLRLDYIFCSEQWEVEKAWIGPWDGESDHRPVMAKLVLK